jgi:peptide deformylase
MEVIAPHTVVSREVTADDLQRVVDDAQEMMNICTILLSEEERKFKEILALAHSQVTKDDPLRFFIVPKYTHTDVRHLPNIICNPEIVTQTKYQGFKKEGCVTFPGRMNNYVARSHKIRVMFTSILRGEDGTLQFGHPEFLDASGVTAQVFAHELDHFSGKYIFPLDGDLK